MGMVPAVGQRPVVGRSPCTPFMAAGTRTDPPVSSATAKGTMRADTAAPEPPLLPPVL